MTVQNLYQRTGVLVAPLVGVALLLAGCSSILEGGSDISVTQTGNNNAPAISKSVSSDDAAIAQREHPRIVATYGGVYSDRKAEIMLARIVSRLMQAANQPDTHLTVTVLDSPEVNAFALPGGYVYVTRGILALSNDASELAAVLAHELSHITLKHARARSNRTRTSEIVDKVVTGIFGENAETDQVVQRSRMQLAAFSQAQEFAADKQGIIYSAEAGYDPEAAARFLGAMGRFSSYVTGGAAPPADDFLATHPSTPERIERATEIAAGYDKVTAPVIGRNEYLEAIDGMTFGENPDHGAIVGHQFIHSRLGFSFSVSSRYTLQNAQDSVVAVAGDGEALRFDSAEVPEDMSLTDYLKSGWIAGLMPETVTDTSRNGFDMASGEAKTEQWAFRVTAVRFKGRVYRFIFAAREDSAAFQSAVKQTLESFHEASRTDLAKIKKTIIKVVRARSGDTTRSLAARMRGVTDSGQLFLILNNLYDGDPIVVGQDYKIVVEQ